jgi:serine/threonine-protein kinase PpkA
MTFLVRLFALCQILALLAAGMPAWAADAPSQPLLMEGKRTLFQRVIVRPGATIFPDSQETGGKPVPGFTVFYVYERRGTGDQAWVQVGAAADGRTQGWIRGAKLIDWKHTIIAAFTNPAGRGRTLFFNERSDLQSLVRNPNAGPEAGRLRADAVAGRSGPVVSLEPEKYVDITRNFYLFPVLEAQEARTPRGTTHLLELIAAVAEKRDPKPPPDPLAKFRAAVVFVVDTTASTQPYIDQTRGAIKDIVAKFGGSPMKENFRFGLVGFRDSLLDTPRLEYTTRVFAKPDFSRPPEAILPEVVNVQATTVSSQSFDEDPIAGIKAAIQEIDWRPLGGRYIILITDAGAREATHPHSYTHLGIAEIASLARENGIALFAIHLKTPEGKAAHDHERAEAQYKMLTRFDNAGGGSFYNPVEGGAPEEYAQTVSALANLLLCRTGETAGLPVDVTKFPQCRTGGTADANHASERSPMPSRMEQQTRVIAEAMRLAYLGRVEETRAPDLVHGFASDGDFADPTIPTLKLRILLTKNQLADLANTLGTLAHEGEAGASDESQLFNRLAIALATAGRDPQRIAQATRFADLLPEYLDGLPYHSPFLNIGKDDWSAMGAIAQRSKLSEIETKIRLYQEYESQRDLWVDLGGSRNPGEAFFPVPVDDLP